MKQAMQRVWIGTPNGYVVSVNRQHFIVSCHSLTAHAKVFTLAAARKFLATYEGAGFGLERGKQQLFDVATGAEIK